MMEEVKDSSPSLKIDRKLKTDDKGDLASPKYKNSMGKSDFCVRYTETCALYTDFCVHYADNFCQFFEKC